MAKLGIALGSGPRGRGFESRHSDQTNIIRARFSEWEAGSDYLFSLASLRKLISETVLSNGQTPNQEAQERKRQFETVTKEKRAQYTKQYNGDERRVERAMSRERFTIDKRSTFDFLYENRNDNEIGQKINVALSHIEEHNSGKLRNVFRAFSFNSQVEFGDVKEKNATLRNLLEDLHDLDLRPSQLDSADIIGDAYEYMIANFASDAGKKGGKFFTPSQVFELVAALVKPQENDRIYDPTCGSGGLLLKAYNNFPSGKVAVYGQELNAQTWALCTMNMFLHGVDDTRIWQGDTLSNPQNIEDDKLMKFQVVVAILHSLWTSGTAVSCRMQGWIPRASSRKR